uniref:Secreted protein n=1 Tax=Anopheles darlingi TaxID=43151 RepID=A0A2M4DK43_ANODA
MVAAFAVLAVMVAQPMELLLVLLLAATAPIGSTKTPPPTLAAGGIPLASEVATPDVTEMVVRAGRTIIPLDVVMMVALDEKEGAVTFVAFVVIRPLLLMTGCIFATVRATLTAGGTRPPETATLDTVLAVGTTLFTTIDTVVGSEEIGGVVGGTIATGTGTGMGATTGTGIVGAGGAGGDGLAMVPAAPMNAPLAYFRSPHIGSKCFNFHGSNFPRSRSASARSFICASGVNSPSDNRSRHSWQARAKNSLFRLDGFNRMPLRSHSETHRGPAVDRPVATAPPP